MCVHTFFQKKRAHMCVCIYINNFNRNTNLQGVDPSNERKQRPHKHSPNLRAAGMFAFFPLHAGKMMKNGGQPDLDIS